MPDETTKHDAHTRVFHELMEPLLRVPKLNGTQFRIIFWVMRNSYGRHGAQFAPFTWATIARDTTKPGLEPDRVRVSREGRALLKRGILRFGAEGELGIDKRRIMELGGDANSHPCENARCEKDYITEAKTHPLSYNKERRKESAPRFIAPTLEEVKAYCQERRNSVDPQKWLDHYTANGWRVGRNPMKDWRAAVRTWERSSFAAPSAASAEIDDARSRAWQQELEARA